MNERGLQDLLREHRAPDEPAAEERAWRVVRAGFPAVQERGLRGRQRRRLALTLAAAAVLLALAVTGPGAAVANWVRDAIGREQHNARPLTSLPAPGRLLIQSPTGPWIVSEDGSKRRLGDYSEATWSPHGLFVAATSPDELVALDPKGNVRWSLARRGGVHQPRWSPDGFRIAYLSGGSIRVVAGDGTGDRRLGPAGDTAPAWQPGGKFHALAYVDRGGAIRVVNADSGPALWRSAGGPVPTQLQWSADGSRLLALSPGRLRIFTNAGALIATQLVPAGTHADTAALSASGRSVAMVSQDAAGTHSRVTLARPAGGHMVERRLLSGPGRFDSVVWSPDDRWLLVSWRTANQWLFIRVPNQAGPPGRVVAFSNIGEQFDPGGPGRWAYPVPSGWCCGP